MPISPTDKPRLRPCEPRPIWSKEGELTQVALRDVSGIAEGMVVLSPPAYLIATLLDGRTSLRDIQLRIARENGGTLIDVEVLTHLVEELDRTGFLVSPRFAELQAKAMADYRAAPAREPTCAGGAYPDDPAELRDFLNGFLKAREADAASRTSKSRTELRGLVAPHIDYRRGGACYADAYSALESRCHADLFVVFGTAHARPEHLFTLTRKSYDTPLGVVPTDPGVVEALVSELGEGELLADELAHKSEHSVELQMVWLKHIFPERRFLAVPVLCSGIDDLDEPEQDPRIRRFMTALAEAVKGRKVCYIAGADLSHVGVMYGDERGPTPAELAAFKADDLKTLDLFCGRSVQAFAMDARRELDSRRICGTAPMFATRLMLSDAKAELLGYGQWTDGTDSVSYCAAGLS